MSQKRDFKKGLSTDDGRRRREAHSIKIRKEKKEEGIAKKRNIMINNFTDPVNEESCPVDSTSVSQKKSTPTAVDIPQLMAGMNSTETSQQLQCLRDFRRMLSVEKNPPVQACIDCGAVPLFVHFLQRTDSAELQFEAAWALTNIASTDRTRLVVDCGAIPPLVALLSSSNPDLREQSAWCLGNVAGDSVELRDIVLGHGGLNPLVANIAQPASLSLLRNCTWSLSNFCRGKPQPSLESIASALPVLANCILQNPDSDTVTDATWAFSYISDGEEDRIQSVVNQGVVPHLARMLESEKVVWIVPALRTLGNIVSGNDSQTQAVVDSNVQPALAKLLGHQKKNIRKEACWMLSNIAAGSLAQMNTLFNTADLIPKILEQLSPGTEWDVRREAAWVVCNLITGGQQPHIAHLVEHGVIRPLCELMTVGDVKIVILAMEALEAVMKINKEVYSRLVDEAGGLDTLEDLQEHVNTQVYSKSVHIIETYFGVEDVNESENIAPASNGNTFVFGTQETSQKHLTFSGFQNPVTTTGFHF